MSFDFLLRLNRLTDFIPSDFDVAARWVFPDNISVRVTKEEVKGDDDFFFLY